MVDGRGEAHFLPVDREFLSNEGGQYYLPVWVIHLDESKGMALVELPREADSGVSRVWVKRDDLHQANEAPA